MEGFILASASPRRRELLTLTGCAFTIEPANIDESAPSRPDTPAATARDLARGKAAAVAGGNPDAVVLAADTIVVLNGVLLGKPADAQEARQMLTALRGGTNQVVTGVAVAAGGRIEVAHATTAVHMRDYADRDIEDSIARGTPFDKAGGYAIQDPKLNPAASVEGCRCNVIGLPLAVAIRLLSDAGVQVRRREPEQLRPECGSCPLFRNR